jgi:hypothetical protein
MGEHFIRIVIILTLLNARTEIYVANKRNISLQMADAEVIALRFW